MAAQSSGAIYRARLIMQEAGVLKVKEKYEDKLLSLPNVVGLGVGYKVTKNIPTRRLCLKVYVQQKVIKSRLGKAEIIPEKIGGVETDVEEIGKVGAL